MRSAFIGLVFFCSFSCLRLLIIDSLLLLALAASRALPMWLGLVELAVSTTAAAAVAVVNK